MTDKQATFATDFRPVFKKKYKYINRCMNCSKDILLSKDEQDQVTMNGGIVYCSNECVSTDWLHNEGVFYVSLRLDGPCYLF